MRLHYGAVPEDPSFHPKEEEYREVAFDPNPFLMQVIALPVAVFLFIVWGVLYFLVRLINVSLLQIPVSKILPDGWLIILLVLIPIHELLHAFAHPQWGISSNTVIGLWLSRGVFYAHYDGVISRNRFLFILITPYLVLGLLPLGLLALPGINLLPPKIMQTLTFISLFGSLFACGDIVGVGLMLFQIPNVAIVRNKGWKTYWKLPS